MDEGEQDRRIAWFKRAVLPHEAFLRAFLARRLRNPSDVEDVASEALIRAYGTQGFDRFDCGRSYLTTIARNLLYDRARRSRVVSFESIAGLQHEPIDDAPSQERVVLARDEARHLISLIDQLPRQCRRVLTMRRIQDKSHSDIAVELGLSVSTVEKHLARALMMLTKMLAEQASANASDMTDETWQKVRTR